MRSYKNQNEELDRAIDLLQHQRNLKFESLKQQLTITYQSIKPVNILNQTLTDFRENPEIKSNLVQNIVGLASGYFSKKLLIGKSNSIFKKILGYAIQFGITNLISKK